MSDITATGLPPAQVPGDPGTEFYHSSPHRLVRNINASLEEHIFDLAQGKIETNIEPNIVGDELRRKAMAFVTDGGRSHGGPLRDVALKANRGVNVTTPLNTLNRLVGWKVSVVAMNGMTFELDTPHGRMMVTMLVAIAQFERDLLSERMKSGLVAARARGKKLGRQSGQRPKSDKLAPKVLQTIKDERSYRCIARDLGISKNTVSDIVKQHRQYAL